VLSTYIRSPRCKTGPRLVRRYVYRPGAEIERCSAFVPANCTSKLCSTFCLCFLISFFPLFHDCLLSFFGPEFFVFSSGYPLRDPWRLTCLILLPHLQRTMSCTPSATATEYTTITTFTTSTSLSQSVGNNQAVTTTVQQTCIATGTLSGSNSTGCISSTAVTQVNTIAGAQFIIISASLMPSHRGVV
jgi:hypothetical protein